MRNVYRIGDSYEVSIICYGNSWVEEYSFIKEYRRDAIRINVSPRIMGFRLGMGGFE
jgi:hypothetical protein